MVVKSLTHRLVGLTTGIRPDFATIAAAVCQAIRALVAAIIGDVLVTTTTAKVVIGFAADRTV